MAGTKVGRPRFWAKLADVNTMEIEQPETQLV